MEAAGDGGFQVSFLDTYSSGGGDDGCGGSRRRRGLMDGQPAG